MCFHEGRGLRGSIRGGAVRQPKECGRCDEHEGYFEEHGRNESWHAKDELG